MKITPLELQLVTTRFPRTTELCLGLMRTHSQITLMKTAGREGKLFSKNQPVYRLVQNRKSAMKCRLKKKHEHDEMRAQLDILKCQGVELNVKVSGGHLS